MFSRSRTGFLTYKGTEYQDLTMLPFGKESARAYLASGGRQKVWLLGEKYLFGHKGSAQVLAREMGVELVRFF